nr:immunoglobulin heavy chain junction region [Macaca mulatta]MOY18111.1 immunoglobulin heavy chain junction region [Macaca mulatta]MOY18147.1 immunoglobulin heavy chain junction region [Macaca mulatta]MOY18462.1 immunoglobulin heavy chain junction region [Macaca mulatta]MOY18661.1 immunoglobulin heavy chain junction region [Macaca mulatta]
CARRGYSDSGYSDRDSLDVW